MNIYYNFVFYRNNLLPEGVDQFASNLFVRWVLGEHIRKVWLTTESLDLEGGLKVKVTFLHGLLTIVLPK